MPSIPYRLYPIYFHKVSDNYLWKQSAFTSFFLTLLDTHETLIALRTALALSPLSVHSCSRHRCVVLLRTKTESRYVGQHLVGLNKAVSIAPKELHCCFFTSFNIFWNSSSKKNPETLSWVLKTGQINSWGEERGRSRPKADADEQWPICKSWASEFALPQREDMQLSG